MVCDNAMTKFATPYAVAVNLLDLDLHPDPPPTARISKKVGIAVLGVVVFVGVLCVRTLCASGAATGCTSKE